MLNGKDVYNLREEYEVDNPVLGNRVRGGSVKRSHLPNGGSVASSDASSFPDAESMCSETVNGSQSESSTATSGSGGTVRGKT